MDDGAEPVEFGAGDPLTVLREAVVAATLVAAAGCIVGRLPE
jgi:hypothetical protein